MRFQYDFVGGPTPQKIGPLVCPRCEDDLNYQQKLLILPPDPRPFRNTRPEDYMADESGPVQALAAFILSAESEIGAAYYLDLYDNDPDQGGDSVLETLTGSATRTNIASVMATVALTASNDTVITITDEAEGSAFVGWVVIFDAATDGDIIDSAPLVNPQTVTMWNGAAFAVGALQVQLTAEGEPGQWDFSNPLQSGQILSLGV
jgi:hypothetical protein